MNSNLAHGTLSKKQLSKGLRIVERKEWLTVREAAEIMNVAVSNVRYLCANEKIECRKFGRMWQVSKDSAESYVRSNRNPDWLHETSEDD